MFRDDKGVAHALSGVCPHRMMPLEKGQLAGNRMIGADETGSSAA
jgi:vanillate O-demethylase monooxygenase subunit